MEEECDRNVTTELTVGTMYSITSPWLIQLLKQNFQEVCHIRYFNFKNMQLTVISFEHLYHFCLLW